MMWFGVFCFLSVFSFLDWYLGDDDVLVVGSIYIVAEEKRQINIHFGEFFRSTPDWE